jgi:hypothetical protein
VCIFDWLILKTRRVVEFFQKHVLCLSHCGKLFVLYKKAYVTPKERHILTYKIYKLDESQKCNLNGVLIEGIRIAAT